MDISVRAVLLALRSSARDVSWIETVNARFFRVVDPGSASQATLLFARSVELAGNAIDSADSIAISPVNGIFDWGRVPDQVFSDAQRFVSAAREGLVDSGFVDIPFVEPRLSVRLRSFLDDPIDLSAVDPPVWKLSSRGNYSWVEKIWDGVIGRLDSRFEPTLDKHYDFSLERLWSSYDRNGTWGQVFNPGNRWSRALSCD